MSQFRVSREGLQNLDEIQVSYTCMAPGMDPAKLAGLNPDGCSTFETAAQAYALDCSAGFAVRSWHVTSTETITYSCCAVAPSDGEEPLISTSATLDSSISSNGLYALAALNFNCPTGQALRRFNLTIPTPTTQASAQYSCVNVPLLRQVREITEQLQTVQWDQFKGSWILARVPNVQVRTPIVDIAANNATAVCGSNAALETWAFGNHGNENQISVVNSCRKIVMKDSQCTTAFANDPYQANCIVGEEVMKKFTLIPRGGTTAPFYNIEYVCCPATKPSGSTTIAQCSNSVTATRAAGNLQPWKFVLTEPDMAIDCQNRMLTGFTIDYPGTNIEVNYTCCLLWL